MAKNTTPARAVPMAMTPSFPGVTIWPYEVKLADGRTIRINAATPMQAKRQAIRQELVGKRKGYRVHVKEVTTLVVTSEEMHRILD